MSAVRDLDPIAAMDAGARWCYAIPANAYTDGQGIVPSLIVEGVPGHFPMLGNGPASSPWYWGKTRAEADATCERANAKRGISPDVAREIETASIAATMRTQNTAVRGRRGS